MSSFTVITRDGTEMPVAGKVGLSVMEHIRQSGMDELLALCGGCCSCATCHVYVETEFMELLPPMSADENDLLDGSEHRQPNSRLSCQVPFQDAFDGFVVRIAPDE